MSDAIMPALLPTHYNGIRIVTHFDYPAIPWRGADWSACLDGYEPGDPTGSGETEAAAVADLIERLEG